MSQNEEQERGEKGNDLPTLPAGEAEEIAHGANALYAQLSTEEGLAVEVETVIREHLRTAVTTDTFFKIYSGLELYLGEDTAVFLLENLRRSDEATYIAHLKNQCAEALWHWLRRLLALYGADFRKAYSIGTEKPDAWDTLNRHTYYDSLNESWIIFLEIVKYNGDRLKMEETPRGALTLAYGIIDMLMNIPQDHAQGLIEKEYLAQVYQQFVQFVEHYAPGLLAEMAEQIES